MVKLFNFILKLFSISVHSHYDLSGDAVNQKHHNYIRREADKIARQALRLDHPKYNHDQQIRILKETFKKFVPRIIF